jgi:hypothetical protein
MKMFVRTFISVCFVIMRSMHSPRMSIHVHYACPNIACDHKYLHVTYWMNVRMLRELIMPAVLGKVMSKPTKVCIVWLEFGIILMSCLQSDTERYHLCLVMGPITNYSMDQSTSWEANRHSSVPKELVQRHCTYFLTYKQPWPYYLRN